MCKPNNPIFDFQEYLISDFCYDFGLISVISVDSVRDFCRVGPLVITMPRTETMLPTCKVTKTENSCET